MRHFYTPPLFSGLISEFREALDIHKTRMNGLSCGEESMTIYSAVLIQYQRVTDGWMDGQTDVQPIAVTCFSIADARKNIKLDGGHSIECKPTPATRSPSNEIRLYFVTCDLDLLT